MDLTLNNAVMGVELSGIRQFTYLVRDTPGACALTIGEPDLNTPDVIKEAAKAALDANDTHYPPGNGYPYALEAISKFEAEAHGLHYAPSEVILTVGATEALFASFSTILNPGDEVIIPTPAFGLYEALVQLQGGVPVSLPTEHNHFQIVPEELKAAITDRTKAIILTSPNNPTGCVYTKETLDAVHAILRDKPIFVLCDDVYRTLTYCEDYHSFAEYQDMRDRIIVVQSFSKPYAMTGWRLGYCMADAKLMDRIQVFHQYCVTSVPSFVQRACVTALETDTSDVVEIFRRRRDYVYQRLVDMGLDVEKPEGAFYMFVDIRKFGMDSNTFCTRMLKEGLVGVIPGIHFVTAGICRCAGIFTFLVRVSLFRRPGPGLRFHRLPFLRAARDFPVHLRGDFLRFFMYLLFLADVAAGSSSGGSFDWSEHPSLSAGLSANRSLPFLFRVVHIVQGHADGDDTGHQSNPYILQAVAHKPVIQERQRRKSPQDRHNHSGRTGQCHHFDYIQNILHLSLPPSLYPSVPS